MIKTMDKLQIYFGHDFVINDKITVHQPTIGEIITMGEELYYSIVHLVVAIPSDMKAQLSLQGIDYEEISDFELFIKLTVGLPLNLTSIFFGDLDFQQLKVGINEVNNELILYNSKEKIVIDKLIYQMIVDYIRTLHNLVAKVEKAGNQMTKDILIEEAKEKLKKSSDKPFQSTLIPLISAMVNSAGFKYNFQEVQNLGIYQFMDSVRRIQVIKNAENTMFGCYSGNVDMKKLNKKELNWLRELEEK